MGSEYSWPARFARQFWALLKKNVILHTRNRRSLIVRLAAPFFFMLLLWLVDKAIQADNSDLSKFKNLKEPEIKAIGAIPACETDLYYSGDHPCYDFVYSPADNPVVSEVVGKMLSANSIPENKVKAFGSKDETDLWLAANTEYTSGAVHFVLNESDISFVLQTNSTPRYFKGDFQNANTFLQMPLQLAAQRAILDYQLAQDGGKTVTQGEVAYSEYAHPAQAALSVVPAAGGAFIYAACMFGFIVQLGNMVMEREIGLKNALRTMGMLDSSYYASWAVWECFMAFCAGLIISVSGYIFQFKILLDNNFFVTFFLFFLFQLAMSAVAFAFTPLVKRSFQAVYVGFLLFLVGWIMQIVILFGIPYKPKYQNNPFYVIWSLFPWNPFYKGIQDLGEMTSTSTKPGISWSRRSSYCIKAKESNFADGCSSLDSICECVMPLGTVYLVLLGTYVLYMVLGMYLDQVIADGSVGSSPIFFLKPSFWFPHLGARSHADEEPILKRSNAAPTALGSGGAAPAASAAQNGSAIGANAAGGRALTAAEQGDQTVQQEEAKMRGLLSERGSNVVRTSAAKTAGSVDGAPTSHTIEVFGLQKNFPGGCRSSGFWALRGSWLSIDEGTIFCLLGPNGAGKTTTINCLTGMMKPTGGDAIICGAPLSSPASLSHIRSRMGVCPQFDVLWAELTGEEHLDVFARVKGVPKAELHSSVASALKEVNLVGSKHARTSTYSGGMRRRLSVAIALLGNPTVVYLDEPTTGMDPISRRSVWDIIENAKKGRAIVLTTHSMEEADILGDRIGIMAKGSLRVIGTSINLKRIFGSGYTLTINLKGGALDGRQNGNGEAARSAAAQAVCDLFRQRLGLVPARQAADYLEFLVGLEQEAQLPALLQELEARRQELGIGEPQIAMSSLEEVFLSIAKQAEVEAASATGKDGVLFTDSTGTVLHIPLGSDTIHNPATDQLCKVMWAQDDAGALTVAAVVPIQDHFTTPVQTGQ